MTTYTVDDAVLHSQAAHDYFSQADRRVLIGLRVTLEMLGIACPEFARPKPLGRPPLRALRDAVAADHPGEREAPLKSVGMDPMHPRRIAAAVAKAQARADAKRGT